MTESKELIENSLRKVESWVEAHGYCGYEPFDGLRSFLRPLTFGSLFGERLLQQLVRQSPVNIRPLVGVSPAQSTKGRGYMAWGYLTMFRYTGDGVYGQKAAACLSWLIENASRSRSGLSWGNHFDFASRAGRIPKLEPIMPWTTLVGQAFLDAYEILGSEHYLDAAVSICNWIRSVPRIETSSGLCFGYSALGGVAVHGANMLGAAMLARTARFVGDSAALELAREAMTFSCRRQNRDGSWAYAEEANCAWIDNFHTAYNLDSLKCYIDNTNDKTFEDCLKRGLVFFKDHFFEATGRPKYYHNRVYPIDIQCASQAIDTLAYMSDRDDECLELSMRVARWTIENMQDDDGHFYYRQLPFLKIRTPMLHWGQATMYRALAHLLSKI